MLSSDTYSGVCGDLVYERGGIIITEKLWLFIKY